MREHASCGACGADDAFLLFRSPDTRNPSSGETFPVGRCRRCSHVYVLDRPTSATIRQYYPADYAEHRTTDAPVGRRHSKRHRRIRLSPGDRVLDVGCGSGYDLMKLKGTGAALFGVETNPSAAATARANGITVYTGTAEQADFPDGHFHQVTMNHCLEHVHDPRAALVNVGRMTRPDGAIHLVFPTSEGVAFSLFRGNWYHLDVPRHLHFFTHRSFLRLTRDTGLRIVHRSCASGSRGFRRSLEASVGGGGLLKRPPASWIAKATLRLMDGLRWGEIAEYVLLPGP